MRLLQPLASLVSGLRKRVPLARHPTAGLEGGFGLQEPGRQENWPHDVVVRIWIEKPGDEMRKPMI